jgi:hypothetical protein
MPDVELDDRRDRRDRRDAVEADAMAGMAFEADRRGMGGGILQTPQLALRVGGGRILAPCLAEGAGMELDSMKSETRMPASLSAATVGTSRS